MTRWHARFTMSSTETPMATIAPIDLLARAKQEFLARTRPDTYIRRETADARRSLGIASSLPGLEGRGVRVGANAWQVRSFGETIEQHRWMHVALLGRPFYTVVLKMSLTSQTDDAIQALRWWLASPGHENGDVIEVG